MIYNMVTVKFYYCKYQHWQMYDHIIVFNDTDNCCTTAIRVLAVSQALWTVPLAGGRVEFMYHWCQTGRYTSMWYWTEEQNCQVGINVTSYETQLQLFLWLIYILFLKKPLGIKWVMVFTYCVQYMFQFPKIWWIRWLVMLNIAKTGEVYKFNKRN